MLVLPGGAHPDHARRPFEFSFSPITSDRAVSVSPGQTGASQRPCA
jgi:hypothetical protein